MATAFRSTTPPRFIHPDDLPDEYALTGTGTCMEPVITDGALLVFSKTQPPERGDTVAVIFTPEYTAKTGVPGTVKRLALALPPENVRGIGLAWLVVVEQLNPPQQYDFRSADVLAVHKCVGFAESAGPGTAAWRPSQQAPR